MTSEKQALVDRLNLSVPEELRQLKAWLVWKKVQRAGKAKFDKVPFYVSGLKRFGEQGSPNDRTRLVTFTEAVTVLERSDFDGIGLAMLGEGFVGLDFDNCVDAAGAIKPEVSTLIEGTYAEKSPSGRGLRAFFAGEFPDRKNLLAGIETFCRQGFLTITGARINGCEIARLSDPLRAQLIDVVGTAQGQTRSDRMRLAKAQDPVLNRLYELGMVERDCGGGKFNIRCPFEDQHTTGGGAGDTVYFLAHTNGFARARFDCKHAHCANRPDEEFRRAIGLGKVEAPCEAGDADWPPLAGVEAAQHLTTDLRSAWRLASVHGRELLHVSEIGWHTWRGTHWERDSEGAVAIAARVSRIIAREAAELLAKAQTMEDDDARKTKLAIAEALAKFARESESRGKIEAALALAKVYLNIKSTALDSDPLILNCANGTLDLKTGELRPHRQGDLLTRCIPAHTTSTRWHRAGQLFSRGYSTATKR